MQETECLHYYGFTGYEHLDDFSLINMNGRMYDPILSMFLSPDPFIQSPETTQNYNRYAYVLNNPLKYTDPTGFSRSAYLEMLMDRYNYEGGGFWYRGTYYSYRSDAGYDGHGGYVASGGPGGSQAIYGQLGYKQTTDYYTAYKVRDGNRVIWVITNYIYSETKQWNEWEFVGYTHPPAGGWEAFEQASSGGDEDLLYPVDPKYPISSGYTENNRTIAELNQSRPHRAIDIATPIGTPIISPYSGLVILAKEFSYGQAIIIQHDYTFNGEILSTSYVHLSQMSVNQGNRVTRGQVIGYTGTYGTGPHLHFVVRLGGQKVNPIIVFPLYE